MDDYYVSQTTQNSLDSSTILTMIIVIAIIAVILFFWLRSIYKKKFRILQAENIVMMQVILPKIVKRQEEKEQTKDDFREAMSVSEQLFSALSSIYKKGLFYKIFGQPHISFEIVARDRLIMFYIGVPKALQNFAEKQIQGLYPDAEIEVNKTFKIFSSELKVKYGMLALKRKFVYPVKTYKQLEAEPLNPITNTLSKLGDNSRATIQILIKPTSGDWKNAVIRAAKNIAEGKSLSDNAFYRFLHALGDQLKSPDKNQLNMMQEKRLTPIQEETMKALREKQSKLGFETQVKVVVAAPTNEEAQMHLDNILNSYSQFNAPETNNFIKVIPGPHTKFITSFILREFTKPFMILNTEELTSIYHFPNRFFETPNIQWLKAKTLSPPFDLPTEGTMFGESHYRGEVKPIYITDDDRRRHMFMIGKTGVGKTTLYMTMIKQDIERGHGCAFLDPNGDAAESLLRFIPKERAEDVIYFDPSDTERPMGLNLLEWKRPEDKDFLIAEWLEIFYKLFDPNKTGMVGPQFEHWGRNAALTVMAQPGGGSLLEIPRLFTDDEFRETCIKYVKDPVVLAFWNQQMAKTADFHKSEMYNYFISKFGRFMTNDLMRNIIGQRKSAFDIREAMDSKKIIIVNLSKGKIGEMNSYLLGMILVSKIQVGAFQRADTPEERRTDFYLFVDEFQNFTTDSFKTILAEARKYKLNLAVANQYIQQLTEPIRDAVIGNAGTLLCYRAGAADAEFMAKELPGVSEQDITNLPFVTLYVKLLINGSPSKPFSMKSIKTEPTQSKELAESIRQLSRLKYGRPKAEVEEDIRKRTMSQEGPAPVVPPHREN